MKHNLYELIVAPPEYPGKKYRGRYCLEHIYIWWLHTGDLPKKGEVIHHINDNKRDNRIENLQKMSNKDHAIHHNIGRHITTPNTKCSQCGKEFRIRPHKLKNPHTFCSRRCLGLFSFHTKNKI